MEMKKYELYMRESNQWKCQRNYRLLDADDVFHFGTDELELDKRDREYFMTIALNTKGEVIGYEDTSVGELSSAVIHPRELCKFLILSNAAATIFLHNHPSGDANPSNEDIRTTKRLIDGIENLIGINVLDHVIIGKGNYTSLRELGYMQE